MPPKKKTIVTNEIIVPISVAVKTKIVSALWQVRELCRKHHLQTLGKESLANQIYQDLLFIYHIPRLCREGILDIDIQRVGDGKISEVSYASLLSLKEPELINASFKRLWKELQRCVLEDLFYGREFTLFAIEKKKPDAYMALLIDLFKYFASIELEVYDSNAGYTYFKKDLNKAIAKTFGQFYTPSTVTYSVVKLVNPKIGEKTLDPSCGSCSFLAEAANYIVKEEGVNIKNAFKDLYGTEVEPNIFAEGVMNIFINFGLIPDMKNRIREVDALLDMAKSEDQFDKIIANPPFGADASTFHEFYFKTQLEPKGKRMVKKIVVNPEVKCQIPFTKTKESAVLFFQFIVEKLKNGGKAGVVMSATILNDSYKEMMEWFLKCCSLEKVVINPAGTFKDQGTGIETFSFIFTKGKPTTTVEIVMLGAENDAVRTLTLDQIKEAGWKLQLKDEEKKVVYTEKYKLISFDQMVTGKNGKNIPEEKRLENGLYPYYASNGVKGSVNNFNFEGPSVLIGDQGSSWTRSVHYVVDEQKFYAGNHTIVLKANAEVNIRYIYYLLSLSNLSVFGKESAIIPEMNKELFYKSRQSNVPLPIQQEIVTNLDRIFADPQDIKDCLAFTDKAMDLMLKDPKGTQLEYVLSGLRLKRAYVNDATSVKSQMAAVVHSVGARGFERKKLGDICEFNTSIPKHDTEYGTEIGRYPFYTGAANNKLFTDTPDVHHLVIIMNRTNGAGKCNLFIDKECSVAGQTIVFYMKEKNEDTLRYLYHYLNTFKSQVEEGYIGSNHKNVSNGFMESFTIELPPLSVQHEVLAILNEMEAELATLEQMAAKAEQRAKFILDGYLTPAK